jgi:two-component system KDP operon response regulator KdpE
MPLEPLVLAIDDEAALLRLIKLELAGEGLRIVTAQSGAEGVRMEEEHRPDLVLLDLVMPEMDGLEVMRVLRDRTNVPIILLTARGSDKDKVRGLELGADDYLPKPFSPAELSARVRAVLRRAAGAVGGDSTVEAGNVSVDLHRRLVLKDGKIVELTRTEWLLLQYLAANIGRVMLNAELLTKVWGPEYRGDLQYLRVWVSRLRKKLEDDPANPRIIKTFQGIGYMFDHPDAPEPREDGALEVDAVEDDALVVN